MKTFITNCIALLTLCLTCFALAEPIDDINTEDVKTFILGCNTEAKTIEIKERNINRKNSDVRVFSAIVDNEELIVKIKAKQVSEELEIAKSILDNAPNISDFPITVPYKYGFFDRSNHTFSKIENVKIFDKEKKDYLSQNIICFQLMKKAEGDLLSLVPNFKSLLHMPEFATACGEALAKLHKHGIVHGDIANGNNIFYNNGKISFIDISRIVSKTNLESNISTDVNKILFLLIGDLKNNLNNISICLEAFFEAYDREYRINLNSSCSLIISKIIMSFLDEVNEQNIKCGQQNTIEYKKELAATYRKITQTIKQHAIPFKKNEIQEYIQNPSQLEDKLGIVDHQYYQWSLCSEILPYSEYSEEEIRQLIKENSNDFADDERQNWLIYF